MNKKTLITGITGQDGSYLAEGDLTDQSSLNSAMKEIQPDEVYNLAAQSFVGTSWNQPVLTGDVTGMGAVRLLESVRHFCKDARIYHGLSKELRLGNLDAKRLFGWEPGVEFEELVKMMVKADVERLKVK